MKKFYKFIFIFLLSMNCYAANPKIYVLFINGVNSQLADVQNLFTNIKKMVDINSNIVEWYVLFNPTSGVLAEDLKDVMNQKRQEGLNMTIDDYVKTYMKSYNLNYSEGSSEYNNLKTNIKEHYLRDDSFVGRNLDEIVRQFDQVVSDKKNSYVLLVAHSQGNLYANQLYDYAINAMGFPRSHLAILGIANPADRMLGEVNLPSKMDQERYITSDTDFVIRSLNTFLLFDPVSNMAMPANIHIKNCNDKNCHGIMTTYMSDSASRNIIINKINGFVISLKKNLLEEQLNKNINVLFWIDEKFSYVSTLRDGFGKVVCSDGTCDEKNIGHIDTKIQTYDTYSNYKWSMNNYMKGPYMLLVPHNGALSSNSGYFLVRGNISIAFDYGVEACTFFMRDKKRIENSRPFNGLAYANIETAVNMGCNLPDEILCDGGSKILLGEFFVN